MEEEDKELERLLAKEDAELLKDQEINRIINAFQLDAYSVLDLQPGCSKQAVTKQYRTKSRFVHPDKTQNKQAPVAFDKLKKAEALLQDDKKRELLDQVFTDARRMLIAEKKWTIHDERLKSEEFLKEWRNKVKQVLVENELRKRKLEKIQMEEEGRLKREQEEQEESRKKQKQQEKKWEENRDSRVESWRNYQKHEQKKKLKKTKKANVLG